MVDIQQLFREAYVVYTLPSSRLSTWDFRSMIRFPFALPSSTFSSIESDLLHDLDASFAVTTWQLEENSYFLHTSLGLSGQQLFLHNVELVQDMSELLVINNASNCRYQAAMSMWNTVFIHFKKAMVIREHYVDTVGAPDKLSDAELFNMSHVPQSDLFTVKPIPYSCIWRYYWLHYSLFWWMMSLTSKVPKPLYYN